MAASREDSATLEAMAAELRLARKAADEANRSRDDFLAAVSHELRTPLTPALALVSIFEQDASLPAAARESMAVARRNLEIEARLIDDLIDLAQISRGELELRWAATDLRQAIESASSICCSREILGDHLTLSMELAAADHRVWGDPARLAQVFWHLLTNAVKFNRQGGSIRVRSRLLPAATAATAAGAERGGGGAQIEVEIADTGSGIAADVLPRIFGAFEAGETPGTRRRAGLGRGLAISRAILEMHGGTLTASSGGQDHGAAFLVRLPCWREDAGAAFPRPQTPPPL
jgi:signal transduction histidine kinase